ncbi:exported hypothetical protein [Gammaproteobacteria bacterium]
MSSAKIKTGIFVLMFFVIASNIAFATADISASSPSVENINLNGKWSSLLFGDVFLEQTDNRVTGTYRYTNDEDITKDGEIKGVIQGRTILGKWWERPSGGGRPKGRIGEEAQGDLEWNISNNDRTLSGWYREEGDQEKHEWDLER